MKHPLRRAKQEITDPLVIDEILKNALACRLAFFDGEEPYIVPLSFGWEREDGDISIYIHCAREGRKIALLDAKKTVCIEIEGSLSIIKSEDPCNWGTAYKSIIGWGIPSEVKVEDEKNRTLNLITSKYGGSEDISFPTAALTRTAVYKITLTKFTAKSSS